MNGKNGFWYWLLQKIWNALKNIPKLPELLKNIAPEFELAFGIIGAIPLGLLLTVIFGIMVWMVWGTFMLLIIAHAIYRIEKEDGYDKPWIIRGGE